MNSKYKVVAIAYKDIDKKIESIVNENSIKILNLISDFNQTNSYCSCRGSNLNDRLCIYLEWFKNDIKRKIEEGYSISIIEIPSKLSDSNLYLFNKLCSEYRDNLLIIGTVDV